MYVHSVKYTLFNEILIYLVFPTRWNSFTRQTFRSEFKVYAVYFVAVFVATYVFSIGSCKRRYYGELTTVFRYLRVGDTFVGMPLGGYRNNIFTEDVGYMEYIRDAARLVYSVINANYTIQEVGLQLCPSVRWRSYSLIESLQYQAYRECGSLRVYLRDGWNWFDLVQISCVWLLLVAEVLELILPGMQTMFLFTKANYFVITMHYVF